MDGDGTGGLETADGEGIGDLGAEVCTSAAECGSLGGASPEVIKRLLTRRDALSPETWTSPLPSLSEFESELQPTLTASTW